MPDPNNPFSYMSADELALLTPADAAGLPPAAMPAVVMALLNRTRQQPAAQPASPLEDQYGLLGSYSPEELEQQVGMGTLDERGQLLDAQLAQARALQNRPMAQHSTAAGALGSGLASVLDTVRGGLMEKDLRGQQQALLAQKDAGRTAYAEALRRRRAQQMQQVPLTAGMGDVPMLPPGVG